MNSYGACSYMCDSLQKSPIVQKSAGDFSKRIGCDFLLVPISCAENTMLRCEPGLSLTGSSPVLILLALNLLYIICMISCKSHR